MPAGNAPLPVLHANEDWLDLKNGERAILRRKVDAIIGREAPESIILVDESWDLLLVDIQPEAIKSQPQFIAAQLSGMKGKFVEMTVTRTEDGIMVASNDLNSIRKVA